MKSWILIVLSPDFADLSSASAKNCTKLMASLTWYDKGHSSQTPRCIPERWLTIFATVSPIAESANPRKVENFGSRFVGMSSNFRRGSFRSVGKEVSNSARSVSETPLSSLYWGNELTVSLWWRIDSESRYCETLGDRTSHKALKTKSGRLLYDEGRTKEGMLRYSSFKRLNREGCYTPGFLSGAKRQE